MLKSLIKIHFFKDLKLVFRSLNKKLFYFDLTPFLKEKVESSFEIVVLFDILHLQRKYYNSYDHFPRYLWISKY